MRRVGEAAARRSGDSPPLPNIKNEKENDYWQKHSQRKIIEAHFPGYSLPLPRDQE